MKYCKRLPSHNLCKFTRLSGVQPDSGIGRQTLPTHRLGWASFPERDGFHRYHGKTDLNTQIYAAASPPGAPIRTAT